MQDASLNGKVALVTGATSGIGKVTARELARLGATVVVAARSAAKAAETISEIQAATGNGRVEFLIADLGVQAEVRALAREFQARHARLDVLVNNAGALNARRTETRDGIETTWAVNHLGYFLLTRELLRVLTATPGARVVNVASEAHRAGRLNWADLEGKLRYSPWQAYAQSKLANILFTRELARRLEGSGVTANALHPGVVASGFGKNDGGLTRLFWSLLSPFARSADRGAQTSVFLASSLQVDGVTGQYFTDCRPARPARRALDDAAAARLWRESEAMLT